MSLIDVRDIAGARQCYTIWVSTREERAARRRVDWSGEVVELGQPKGRLYSLRPEERLAALARLNERAWRASGGSPRRPVPRSQWPGEIFEIRRHD